MAHIRKQLRDHVKAILISALGTGHIFVNRTHVIQPAELPCAVITTDSDLVIPAATSTDDREISLTINVYEKAFSDVDDLLDALCVKIENAFKNDTTITAQTLELNETRIDIQDGDQPVGVATMLYTVTFLGVTDPEETI